MEEIRAFIAAELPGEIKQALTRLQGSLKAGSRAPAKWVDPAGIHLTLKFLGNIGADAVAPVLAALEAAAREAAPIRLEVRELGAFPNLNRPQVIWVGLGGETDRLAALQKAVEGKLRPLGFTPESRPFTPHLTLARLREQAAPAERQQLGQLVAATGLEATGGFYVKSIHLMRSRLTREGAIYSRLGSAYLKKPPAP